MSTLTQSASSAIPTSISPPAAVVPGSTPNADGLEDSDALNEVFIESTWRGRLVKYDREQQADALPRKDQASQARVRTQMGVQTESNTMNELRADAPLPQHFPSWLAQVYPDIHAQLEANLESHAFDDYLVAWGDEAQNAYENIFTLEHQLAINELNPSLAASSSSSSDSKSKSKSSKSKPVDNYYSSQSSQEHAAILDVGWSCNGSILVASYGSSAHVGWCNHSSGPTLAFWNIMRRQISSVRPDFTLEQDCCCMCVAYHPERPTILAGGMFNGEVRVWDTSLLDDTLVSGDVDEKDAGAGDRNPCIMRSHIDDFYHREPITHLAWVKDSARAWQLVSVSGDGKILFWPMDDPSNKLSWPQEGYLLAPTEQYAGSKLGGGQPSHHGAGGAGKRIQVFGGTCIAFPSATSQTNVDIPTPAPASSASSTSTIPVPNHFFLATTEGGGVLRFAQSNIIRRRGYQQLGGSRWNRDALRLAEQSAPATKLALKKAIEQYAKSKNADSIELEHVFGSRPDSSQLYPHDVNLAFESHAGPVYGLAFNAFDSRLFATASSDGRIKLFHIQNPKPLLILEPGPEYLFSLIWSPSRPLVFACCDAVGHIFIYDLLASMTHPTLIIDVNKDKSKTSIECLSWNQAEPSILLCGDMRGRVNVFNLSSKYSKVQPGEKRLLEQIANIHRPKA